MTTSDRVRESLGFFWTDVFLQHGFVDSLANSLQVCLDDVYAGIKDIRSVPSRRKVSDRLTMLQALILEEDKLETFRTSYGDGSYFGDGASYGDTGLYWRYPYRGAVPEFIGPTLSPEEVLTRDTDFWFRDNYLWFNVNPFELPNVELQPYRVDTAGTPVLRAVLWGLQNVQDLKQISDIYGIFAGVSGATTSTLVEAINLAWDLRVTGATAWNLRRVLYVSAGCHVPAVPPAETVESIRFEGDSYVVATANYVLTSPKDIVPLVTVGDIIDPDLPVFDAFSIHRPPLPPDMFPAMLVGSGQMSGIRYGVTLLNQETEVSGPPYRFDCGGTSADKDVFFDTLNTAGFFDVLKEIYGRVPAQMNPVVEINRILGPNTLFIRTAVPRSRELSALFSVLQDVYPAGSSILFLMSVPEITDTVQPVVTDSVEVFAVIDSTETIRPALQDRVLVGTI